jgi:GDP-L-fucose synthase
MVGSAIVRKLNKEGYSCIIGKTINELDLTQQAAVNTFFEQMKPDYVFLAAAKVGGIWANHSYPADFLYTNLAIQTNVIKAAHDNKVKKLLFLGSSCIYPKICPQPILEEYLLTGPLEPTNEAYAVAKIAGLKMCQFYKMQYGESFISVMPTNLYGPNDTFDLATSHVIPALIRKFHEAKTRNIPSVEVWGTGKPRREFLHVDDLAEACFFLMNHYEGDDHMNVGTGKDTTIAELATAIKNITGYQGKIIFNPDKPDGSPQKLLDTKKVNALGWKPRISLMDGLLDTYHWYVSSKSGY